MWRHDHFTANLPVYKSNYQIIKWALQTPPHSWKMLLRPWCLGVCVYCICVVAVFFFFISLVLSLSAQLQLTTVERHLPNVLRRDIRSWAPPTFLALQCRFASDCNSISQVIVIVCLAVELWSCVACYYFVPRVGGWSLLPFVFSVCALFLFYCFLWTLISLWSVSLCSPPFMPWTYMHINKHRKVIYDRQGHQIINRKYWPTWDPSSINIFNNIVEKHYVTA